MLHDNSVISIYLIVAWTFGIRPVHKSTIRKSQGYV